MRQSRTFFRNYSNLLYDLVVSIKEIYYKITKLTERVVIDLRTNYTGTITEPVKSYTYCDSQDTIMETGEITAIHRGTEETILILIQSPNGARLADIYEMELSELVKLYAELEKIYQLEKKKAKSVAR